MNKEVITPSEVAVLNAARHVLGQIRERNNGTMVQGTTLVAEFAVFSVLNHCNAYLAADLTYSDLHGAEEVAA